MENKPVILIVEDEAAIVDFLAAKLESGGYRTLAAANGREAISSATSHCPDLVLLDLGLPDMDGMDVLKFMRGWSALPIIILSARQQEEDIVAALDSGADDYITKPFSNSVLMARVRTALRKGVTRVDRVNKTLSFGGGGLSIDFDRRRVSVEGQRVHLTPVEYRILTYLARNAGAVITHTTLLRELWGPYATDNRLLRVNMANLRRKIEANSADPRYILTEVGVGYRMVETD